MRRLETQFSLHKARSGGVRRPAHIRTRNGHPVNLGLASQIYVKQKHYGRYRKLSGSMKMLLKELIKAPMTSSKLLVCDPFRELDREELVAEVIGLANADVEGPRIILFGINAGAVDGSGIVGITDGAMAELKKAHRTISELIEPFLQLALIYDRINGKLVGALEIDGCDDQPYIVGKNYSKKLSRGLCWVREGRELRAVQPAEVAQSVVEEEEAQPTVPEKLPPVAVGFNDDPACRLIELTIPDSSNPPFAEEKPQDTESQDLKKTLAEKIGTVTTRILRMGSSDDHAETVTIVKSDLDAEDDDFDGTETVLSGANDHYFFEEKALHVNLCVRNMGSVSLDDVSIKLGFPRIRGFDVVDRLYTSPFDKRPAHEIKKLGYPSVERHNEATLVSGKIDRVDPDSPKQVFKCDLRLAVAPSMRGKKLAIRYTLRASDQRSIGKGRLKIKFGKTAA